MTQWTTLNKREPDEAAFPEPPGGGLLLAVAGGLSAAGAVFLVFFPPLVIAWLAAAAVLTGIATRTAVSVIAATAAAVAPAIATFALVQCLTGAWGWLLAGIVVFAAVTLVGVPVGFVIGRVLRSRLARWFTAIRAVLVATAVISAIGWALLIASAIAPGECPAAL